MAWVQRKAGGIVGVYRNRQDGYAEEELADDHSEVLAFLPPPPEIDQSNLDNIAKCDKAILLAAATMAGRTPAQARAAFKAAWDALP